MKIMTWNCQGSFRKKAVALSRYSPDLVIVQECEDPERLRKGKTFTLPENYAWIGDNPNRGVGVFSFGDFRLEIYEGYDSSIKYCLPVCIQAKKSFHLLAIWAKDHPDRQQSYVGQVYQAVHRYADFIREEETLVIGDLNSNKIWDQNRRISNHSAVVSFLEAEKIISVYHSFYKQAQGEEEIPTFYLFRRQDKPYHLDYCFAPESWISRVKSFWVGQYEDWKTYSDHCPVFVEFDLG